MKQHAIRVSIRHGAPLVAAGLTVAIAAESGFELVNWTAGSEPAPDVLVADYDAGLLCMAGPGQPNMPSVLILSHRQSEAEIRYALERGARGYLPIDCVLRELFDALRALRAGMRYFGNSTVAKLATSMARPILTERETDVLRLMVEGDGNKRIAQRLSIAPDTVKAHAKAIFVKLGAATRTEVATLAERRGLLKLPNEAGKQAG